MSTRCIGQRFVYFIQCGQDGPIKIGVAGSVEKRMADLQVAHFEELRVLAFGPGDLELECHLHEAFAKDHIRGEWFRPSKRILSVVDALTRTSWPPCDMCGGQMHVPREMAARIVGICNPCDRFLVWDGGPRWARSVNFSTYDRYRLATTFDAQPRSQQQRREIELDREARS